MYRLYDLALPRSRERSVPLNLWQTLTESNGLAVGKHLRNMFKGNGLFYIRFTENTEEVEWANILPVKKNGPIKVHTNFRENPNRFPHWVAVGIQDEPNNDSRRWITINVNQQFMIGRKSGENFLALRTWSRNECPRHS